MPISATSFIVGSLVQERNGSVANHSDIQRYWAQFAYIAIIPFSIVEVIFTQALKCVTYFAGSSNHEYRYFKELATSSLWGLLWTIDCIFMNLCSKYLYTNERAYVHFISNFSCRSFRKRFNQEDITQALKKLEPRTVSDPVKQLLADYEVGQSALEYSAIYEMLYEMLPEVTPAEIRDLPGEIEDLMRGSDNKEQILKNLRTITEKNPIEWTELNRRFIKMLIFTKKTIKDSKNREDLPNFKERFSEVFKTCVNRMTVEMESIFFQFAAHALFDKIQTDLLQKNRVNESAKLLKLVYKMLPEPTKEEVEKLTEYIFKHAETFGYFLTELTDRRQPRERVEAKQRFIKMLFYTYKTVIPLEREVEQLGFIESLLQMQGNLHLDNGINESLFFRYGIATLFKESARECLLYDYTQHRKDSSTFAMQVVLEHHDVATNLNYYADSLHDKFGLPRPPLSSVDPAYRNTVSHNCRAAIITAFTNYYLSPHTIYDFFYEIFIPQPPGHKDFRRFHRKMYEDWAKKKYFDIAKKTATLPEGVTSLQDFVAIDSIDENGMPHPADVIEFLVEMKLLKVKVPRGA